MIWLTLIAPVFAGAAVPCTGMSLDLRPGLTELRGAVTALSVRVSRTAAAQGCSFFVTFDNGGARIATAARRLEAEKLAAATPVQLSKDSAGTQVLTPAGDVLAGANSLSGSLAGGSGQTFVDLPYFARREGPPARPGVYAASFGVSLFAGSPGDSLLVATRRLTLHVTEEPRAAVTVADGEVTVRANAPYRLALTVPGHETRDLPGPSANPGSGTEETVPLPKTSGDEPPVLSVFSIE